MRSALRDGVVIDLLHRLGVLSAEELSQLADLRRPVLRNHRGLEVGDLEVDFELEEGEIEEGELK